MFEGFELASVDTGEVRLRVRFGGSGPPLVLLHGHPQNHVMWHRMAPALAESFTVVCPDLRGYGGSDKPSTSLDYSTYSKRRMGNDIVDLMHVMGFSSFGLTGHDRGGRVAYRLALDHPDLVTRLAVLDIIPTGEIWKRMDASFAFDWWHWLFLAQPAPLPEHLIEADPDYFYFGRNRHIFDTEALDEYLRWVREPETIRAMCNDYRAGATIDREVDDEDRGERLIQCPLLVLWSGREPQWKRIDVLEVWRAWASRVEGRSIDAGHYLAEEEPGQITAELIQFFR